MAVELRNRLAVGFGLKRTLPATLMFDHPTIEAIATYLAREVFGSMPPPPARTSETPSEKTEAKSEQELAQMSDEDVEALLLQRLESL